MATNTLFTGKARVAVFDGEPDTTEPTQTLNGRDEMAAAFGSLQNYDKTTHFNGQSTVILDGDRATGEPTVWRTTSGSRRDSAPSWSCRSATGTPSSAQGGRWFFAERRLITDWVDRRPSTA